MVRRIRKINEMAQTLTTGKLDSARHDDMNHGRIPWEANMAIQDLILSAWDNANDTLEESPESSPEDYERVAMTTLEMNLCDFPKNWPQHEDVKAPVRAWFETQFGRRLWRY